MTFEKLLEQELKYIYSQQLSDGSFSHLSAHFKDLTRTEKKYISTFPASLTLTILSTFKSHELGEKICAKTNAFLKNQRSQFWSFNYWPRDSTLSKKMPYPDDLDDTFCALTALYLFDSTLFNSDDLVKIVTLLTTLEVSEGGPYKTWLVSEDTSGKWSDIDIAVNCNIAYFLSLIDVQLTPLNNFITEKIQQQKFDSPYYPNDITVYYFISRFYKENTDTLINLVKRYKPTNILEIALKLSTLINLGFDQYAYLNNLYEKLLKNKSSWRKAYPLYIDPSIGNKKNYAGSSVLTVTFCLEAIDKYNKINIKIPTKKTSHDLLYNSILHKIETNIDKKHPLLYKNFSFYMQRIIKMDDDKQIILLPFYFQEMLGKKAKKLSKLLLTKLSMGTFLGWLAYTLYDDFLDDEADIPSLPIATVALRELTVLFHTTIPSRSFHKIFQDIMNELDNANLWEVSNCRFSPDNTLRTIAIPDYGNYRIIAAKSLGHVLGPIAILYALNIGSKKNVSQIIKVFTHYIIARQLNDDAHDWQEDLQRGQINSVSASLLKNCKIKSKDITVQEAIPLLTDFFWEHEIEKVRNLIHKHSKLCRKTLEETKIIEHPDIFISLLKRLESAADQAINEKKQLLNFIDSYKKK